MECIHSLIMLLNFNVFNLKYKYNNLEYWKY